MSTKVCQKFWPVKENTSFQSQLKMSVVIKGRVTIKVQGVLKQKQLSGNWAILYDGGGGGKDSRPPCIELFHEKDQQSPVHTIVLEHLKFSDKSYRQRDASFMLSIKKEKHQFQFENEGDKDDWVQSLCHVSQDLWKQRASTRESSEIESDSVPDMSDNLLYDSCDKVHQFKVSVNPTKASEANSLESHYMLNPTKDSLRLLDIHTGKNVHEWPYRQIRKFGCTRKIFRMEVGRRCTTGAGEFEFFTPDGATLADLISKYTKQVLIQDQQEPQLQVASKPSVGSGETMESQTAGQRTSEVSGQQVPSGPVPSSMTHLAPESIGEANVQDIQKSQKGSNSSLDSKREPPKPVPRSSINKSKKENVAANGVNEVSHASGDTKIYETPTGLTAPLDSQLKNELHSKLHSQMSHTSDIPSRSSNADIEVDSISVTESSTGRRGSSESVKEKKKSDKERKKLEKEQKAAEAKRKKQQEKEQKEREKELREQREKEAKEEKERQKRLKKESRAHEKLKSKKSLDVPAPTPVPTPAVASFSDGNIYDEPDALLQGSQPAPSLPPDPGYCEPVDIVPTLSKPTKPTNAEAPAGDVYATPQKPKNSWKTHARPESEHVHQENYDSIRQSSQSQPPPVPLYPQWSRPPPDDADDTYNRLGDFKPSLPAMENIYGMASAKDTVRVYQSPPASAFSGGHEYEEADAICTALRPQQGTRQVREEYEDTDVVPQSAAFQVDSIPAEGEYAEVSSS